MIIYFPSIFQQLSQFWYDEKTIRSLSKVCLNLVLERHQYTPPSDIRIALLSCPSLYPSIKKIHPSGIVRLFEFDTRFSTYPDFVFYDYKDENGINLRNYSEYFDIIISDPPFLSQECIENTAKIIKRFRKENASIIMCSGHIAKHWIEEFLLLNLCEFRPGHEKNLANEFCAYANFELDKLIVWTTMKIYKNNVIYHHEISVLAHINKSWENKIISYSRM